MVKLRFFMPLGVALLILQMCLVVAMDPYASLHELEIAFSPDVDHFHLLEVPNLTSRPGATAERGSSSASHQLDLFGQFHGFEAPTRPVADPGLGHDALRHGPTAASLDQPNDEDVFAPIASLDLDGLHFSHFLPEPSVPLTYRGPRFATAVPGPRQHLTPERNEPHSFTGNQVESSTQAAGASNSAERLQEELGPGKKLASEQQINDFLQVARLKGYLKSIDTRSDEQARRADHLEGLEALHESVGSFRFVRRLILAPPLPLKGSFTFYAVTHKPQSYSKVIVPKHDRVVYVYGASLNDPEQGISLGHFIGSGQRIRDISERIGKRILNIITADLGSPHAPEVPKLEEQFRDEVPKVEEQIKDRLRKLGSTFEPDLVFRLTAPRCLPHDVSALYARLKHAMYSWRPTIRAALLAGSESWNLFRHADLDLIVVVSERKEEDLQYPTFDVFGWSPKISTYELPSRGEVFKQVYFGQLEVDAKLLSEFRKTKMAGNKKRLDSRPIPGQAAQRVEPPHPLEPLIAAGANLDNSKNTTPRGNQVGRTGPGPAQIQNSYGPDSAGDATWPLNQVGASPWGDLGQLHSQQGAVQLHTQGHVLRGQSSPRPMDLSTQPISRPLAPSGPILSRARIAQSETAQLSHGQSSQGDATAKRANDGADPNSAEHKQGYLYAKEPIEPYGMESQASSTSSNSAWLSNPVGGTSQRGKGAISRSIEAPSIAERSWKRARQNGDQLLESTLPASEWIASDDFRAEIYKELGQLVSTIVTGSQTEDSMQHKSGLDALLFKISRGGWGVRRLSPIDPSRRDPSRPVPLLSEYTIYMTHRNLELQQRRDETEVNLPPIPTSTFYLYAVPVDGRNKAKSIGHAQITRWWTLANAIPITKTFEGNKGIDSVIGYASEDEIRSVHSEIEKKLYGRARGNKIAGTRFIPGSDPQIDKGQIKKRLSIAIATMRWDLRTKSPVDLETELSFPWQDLFILLQEKSVKQAGDLQVKYDVFGCSKEIVTVEFPPPTGQLERLYFGEFEIRFES